MPVTTQHYPMLRRNLLYTGVTRGRQLVVLVAQPKAVAIAVKGQHERRRWSKLHEWLTPRALERASPAAMAWKGSVLPLPEVLEAVGAELGVAGGVLDGVEAGERASTQTSPARSRLRSSANGHSS